MIEMRVLDYRITSDDRQVIVNKARRNEHGELTILTDKDGTQRITRFDWLLWQFK